MLAAFGGWNDACQASTNLVRHLLTHYESHEVRSMDCDDFYDYQTTRPMLCHVTGSSRIIWPQTAFYEIHISPERHIFAQLAPEPNYHWKEYCQRSLAMAAEFEVDQIITLGSMFDDCPHTRALPVSLSEHGNESPADREYNGPVGLPSVLNAMADEDGLDTASIWVSIPQYLGSDECAQASLQMLGSLSSLLGVNLDTADLPGKAARWKAQADVLTRCNDELQEYVRHLEHEYDMQEEANRLADFGAPQAQQLVKEAEEFLSRMGE
ncbi:PAC2 family protein [Bifidobacterium aemilianum]|uniref:PAC2 family protein n=2 Tax=Bifidobacterium aemilianum TaxID=2493120 RepID=A0A366K8T9_9BIFI|nr:PAC2 family protein [Bifidobacterium aemilianum]RBP98079.1 PAC2 family protein [Bifidobacterium aemilianum]